MSALRGDASSSPAAPAAAVGAWQSLAACGAIRDRLFRRRHGTTKQTANMISLNDSFFESTIFCH